MDKAPINLAIERIQSRKKLAREEYDEILRTLHGPDVASDPIAIAVKLVRAMDVAELTVTDLKRDTAHFTDTVTRKRVHLYAGVHYGSGGTLNSLHVRDLISAGRGNVDLSGYEIVPASGQSQTEFSELIQTIEDFNSYITGKSEAGYILLKKAGLARGSVQTPGTAENVAARFKLWQIRLACIESAFIKRKNPDADLQELTYQRLGLGGLCKPVLSGDIM